MKNTILKILLLALVIAIWLFSLLELFNLSALYKDQVETGEFFLSIQKPKATQQDYIELEKTRNEINGYRLLFLTLFIGIPAFAIAKTVVTNYKLKRQNKFK